MIFIIKPPILIILSPFILYKFIVNDIIHNNFPPVRIDIPYRIINAIRIRSNRIILFRQRIDRTPYRIFREILAGAEIIDFIVRNILQLLARESVFRGIGRQ